VRIAIVKRSNIVPLFEVGKAGEVSYYAMQLIQGQGLDTVIDELRRLKDRSHRTGPAKGPDRPDPPIRPGRWRPLRDDLGRSVGWPSRS
jgi:hypothetical protein